jgi:hypothetical protein
MLDRLETLEAKMRDVDFRLKMLERQPEEVPVAPEPAPVPVPSPFPSRAEANNQSPRKTKD